MHTNLPKKMLAEAALELQRTPETPFEIMYCSGILFALGEYHDAIYLTRHAENIKWLNEHEKSEDNLKETTSRRARIAEILNMVLGKIIACVGEDDIARTQEGQLP